MLNHFEILRRHAGIFFEDDGSTQTECLYEKIWKLRKQPDDVTLPENLQSLERYLNEFLSSAFALDQKILDINCLYAFTRLGTELSKAAIRCETIGGTKEWLRLRLVLDVSFDAIIAGDMHPYEEMVPHEFSAIGVTFSFLD